MIGSVEKVRGDFSAREESLKVFEIFSGTATPGEDGAPDVPGPGEPDPGLTVSDALAIGTLSSLGLTGLSYGMKRYSAGFLVKDPANPLTAMKLIYDRMQVAKAFEAVKEGKSSTKLMEFLPYVGVPVKRMNIDKLWSEVEDSLKQMKIFTDNFAAGYQAWESNWEKINKASSVAFVGFGSVSALGAIATTATAALHDRAAPLLDDFAESAASLEGRAALRADAAVAEFGARASFAMETLDAKIDEIALLAKNLPDFDGMVDILAEAEGLLDPIKALSDRIETLIDPFEGFLDVADVISAPISGILDLFENPPKVLPTIVGYKTITPGFWLTVPDPTWSNPLQTKRVWVDPVKVPIPGFKELFNPIPRDEVQKIIDLITKIAGLPQELLEKALSPILQPLQNQIDKLLQPILDKLNPFTEYLDDFSRVPDAIKTLRDKLGAVLAEIEESVAAISRVAPSIDPIEEIGPIDPEGMPTYFGDDADEFVRGAARGDAAGPGEGASLAGRAVAPSKGRDTGSGTFDGAVLSTGAGDDTLVGTELSDFLMGGADDDEFRPGAGDDVIAGGSGDDLVVFSGARADYILIKTGRALEAIGPDGANLLTDVETLRFDDGDVEVASIVAAATSGDDTIDGSAAADRIVNRLGSNKIDGGDGADFVVTGAGADTLLGGGDRDRLKSGAGDDSVDGGDGDDRILAGDGDDTVMGGAGDDVILPGRGNDVIDGGDGNDIARGFRGGELISGGAGDDTLLGGLDDDTIVGGGGNDRMAGGPGRDTFLFNEAGFGRDRIVDFRLGSDVIDFRGAGVGRDDLELVVKGGNTVVSVAGSDDEIVVGGVDLTGREDVAFLF